MASKLWTGRISFGLVTIPVSLVTAEAREELDFTLLDRRDDSPIGYQKIVIDIADLLRKSLARGSRRRFRRRKTA